MSLSESGRWMGFRQSKGGRGAVGSLLSAGTKVFLASDLLPQRHIPECQGLNLDPTLRCGDKQYEYGGKALSSWDSRPMSPTAWGHRMLRKAICHFWSPQALQLLTFTVSSLSHGRSPRVVQHLRRHVCELVTKLHEKYFRSWLGSSVG